MTNKTSTRRAFITSATSLLLCVVMLIGSTFAWFTDNASTGTNSIQSGNLDVELQYSYDMENWEDTKEKTEIFDPNALWEPGYTEVVYFKVINKGSLAFYYDIGTNVLENGNKPGVNQAGEEFLLSDYLQFGIVETAAEYETREEARAAIEEPKKFSNISAGTKPLSAGEEATFAMVVWMPEDVGNEANHNGSNIPSIQFGISVIAKQADEEEDSFGKTYDIAAEYGEKPDFDEILASVGTATEFKKVLEDAFTGGSAGTITINLTQSFDVSNWTTIKNSNYSGVNDVVINGNGFALQNLDAPLIDGTFAGKGILTVNNLIIKDADITVAGNINNLGVGIILGYVDAAGGANFNGVKVYDSKITATGDETCVGALVGYSSAGYANFTNCEVVNTTVSGTKYAGGLIGMTYGTTASSCSITGCTFDDAATYKGVVAAHCLSGQSTFKNITATDNNIEALCGRETVPPVIE